MGGGHLSDAFGLFVSSVEGLPVARFGSSVLIGAERDLIDRRAIRYYPERIDGIPHAEARKYAREYRRAIDNGSLVMQTADAWREQQQNQSREVGAPRDKLTAGSDPPEDAKEAHEHSESSR